MRPYEILIKSFLRPICLSRLLDSIWEHYPDVTVRICDDGRLQRVDSRAKLYKLPFYSGLAVGKNYLVSLVETPYFVMMDDDFIITKDTDLDKLLTVVKSVNDCAVVAGQVAENGVIREGVGHLEVDYSEQYGRRLTRYYYGDNAPREAIAGVSCIPCRMACQLFMGSKKVWNDYGIKWRDELKRCEHYAFFLDLPKQVKCYVVPDVIVEHKPERNPEYNKYKADHLYKKMVCERVTRYERAYE